MENTEINVNNIVSRIKLTPVISSNLVAIGYSEQDRVLEVMFKGGNKYIYFNVEPDVYNNLATSDSKGKTLNESIVRQKDKYKYLKLN